MDKIEQDINRLIILLGIEKPEITVLNDSLIEMINEIDANHKSLDCIDIPPISKRTVKQNTQKFMTEKLKLHPIRYKGILLNIERKLLKLIKSEEKARMLVNNMAININPFDLPVYFINQNTWLNSISFAGLYNFNDSYIRDTLPFFDCIYLERNPNNLTDSSYVHELTHSQLIDDERKIKKYCNFEVLPIFLDLLITYEKNSVLLCRVENQSRLNELKDYKDSYLKYKQDSENTSYGELIELGKYFESDLKAYYLLIEYINGTPAIKKYILSSIQDVFDANLDLESFLDNIGATLDNISNDRRLVKYFCR